MSEKRAPGIDHVGLTVPDIELAMKFFQEALAGEGNQFCYTRTP